MNSVNIDEQVLRPLADYLRSSPFDAARLERAVERFGFPDRSITQTSDFKGFALEVYFKVALADFMKDKCTNLNGIPINDGTYSGLRVKTDCWGTLLIRNAQGSSTAELDSLCEYQADRETIPILFETTFTNTGGLWQRKRPVLARILKGKKAYLCKVRPVRSKETPALYIRDTYTRKILVPYAAEIERFGQILSKNAAIPQRQKSLPYCA